MDFQTYYTLHNLFIAVLSVAQGEMAAPLRKKVQMLVLLLTG
jgi:hypothetical protein